MASGSKFNQALYLILEDLNENVSEDVEVDAIEAENAQLRQKKIKLMGQLDRHSTVSNSVILVKDMLLRQQNLNQARYESKEHAAIRYKNRSREAAAQVASWKQKLQEIDNLITLPHNEVLEKIFALEEKIGANRSKINELIQEHAVLNRNRQEGSEDILNLNDTLKCVEKEQRKLLEKLKKKFNES